MESYVKQAIEEVYLTREKGNYEATLTQALLLVKAANSLRLPSMQLPPPTSKLVRRLISEIPAFDVCLAREGRDIANNKFRASLSHKITHRPLERAEIDHTRLDLMLVDESGFPMGRPWVTACIDDYSRCILGISVSFEPPSFFTVAQCLKSAILPKTNLREEYPEIKSSWDAHGIMRELVVDNGYEFHSESLEKACYSLGIEIHYSARKTPWFKGKIERFLGTFNQKLAHGNPGTTFSNIFEKNEYDPIKHSVIKYSTFQKIYRMWVADIYHQENHRTLGATPAAVWSSSIDSGDILLPDNVAHLDAILGRSETRVLTHKGIELDCLLYNSHELLALRKKLGEKFEVQIRVDDSDLSKIIVLAPDSDELFTVPALQNTYTKGLTAYQHKICKNVALKSINRNDADACLEAKHYIENLISQDLRDKRKKTNEKVVRFKGDKNLLPKPLTPPEISPTAQLSLPSYSPAEGETNQPKSHFTNKNKEHGRKRVFEPIITTRDSSLDNE